LNLVRIIGYFLGEASSSLWRSWRVSLLAILTIAMSIFIGGTFMLLSGNLGHLVESWRDEAKIIVYTKESLTSGELDRVRALAVDAAWVTAVDEVAGPDASSRFQEMFPSVGELLESWEEEPLPASLELSFDPSQATAGGFDAWLAEMRDDPAVMLVDDDRDWLRQLDTFVGILRGLGLVVGLALLGAAVVTIASVIRLTAYLYRDEIAVMRLVGATELYIRGPFFFEGLIQGFLGGALAISGLYAAFLALNPRSSTVLLGNVLIDRFLPWSAVLGLLAVAMLAGLAGAILSLRRENLAAD
jgi:cell division transport system permease protein